MLNIMNCFMLLNYVILCSWYKRFLCGCMPKCAVTKSYCRQCCYKRQSRHRHCHCHRHDTGPVFEKGNALPRFETKPGTVACQSQLYTKTWIDTHGLYAPKSESKPHEIQPRGLATGDPTTRSSHRRSNHAVLPPEIQPRCLATGDPTTRSNHRRSNTAV